MGVLKSHWSAEEWDVQLCTYRSKYWRAFWGLGVFLSDKPACYQSMSRAVYWAGGVEHRERGEPIIIQVKGLSESAEGVQKAVCVQVMYGRGQQGILMSAVVDPSHLRPLIWELLDTLKIHVQTLRERFQRNIECNQQNPQNPPMHLLTLVEVLHDIVAYRCKMDG